MYRLNFEGKKKKKKEEEKKTTTKQNKQIHTKAYTKPLFSLYQNEMGLGAFIGITCPCVCALEFCPEDI